MHGTLWCSESCDCNKDKMHCGYGTLRTTAAKVRHQVSHRAAQRSQLLSKDPADLHRGFSCSEIRLSYKSNITASWMHLYNCKCFEEHLRMLLQSLKALCLAPVGPGSIWKYLEALVRSTGVSGRLACGFQTNLHFADEDRVNSEMHFQAVIKLLWWCACRDWSHNFGDALGGHDRWKLQGYMKVLDLKVVDRIAGATGAQTLFIG